MRGTRGMGLASFSVYVFVLALAAGNGARAETLPVHVKMEVKTARGVQRRTLESVQGRWERDGSFTAPVEMSGNGWSFGAVIRGYVGPSRQARGLHPRGVNTMEATVGVAAGAIAGNSAANFTVNVCVDQMLVNGTTFVGPPIQAVNTVYGGSVGGALIDAGGDGTATLSNDTSLNPMYRLRTTTGSCAGAIENTVATLYDNPSGPFTVATAFGSGSVPESTFGTPIPSNDPNVDINGGLDLRLNFRVTDFDIGVMTAVGHVEGDQVSPVALPSRFIPRGAPSSAAPGLVLVQRSQQAGNHYLKLAVAHGSDGGGPFVDNFVHPLGAAIGPLTRAGGVMIGSLTDFGGTTCHLRDNTLNAIYEVDFDNVTVFSMRPPPQDISISSWRSTLMSETRFGDPIPSAIGPQADTLLEMALHQNLENCLSATGALLVVGQTGVTATPTSLVSPTPSGTPTRTSTPGNSPTATNTSIPSNTPTVTHTPTRTSTPTITSTASNTSTPTNTSTRTNTATVTNTRTPTNTPTITNTPDISALPAPASIPTLSGLGTAVLLLLLLGLGVVFLLRARGQS